MGVANVGHTHREVVAAVRAQAERHLHVMVYGEMIQQPQVDLAARLAGLLPPPLEVVYFTSSGAEAVEGALKTARKHTGRRRLFAFERAGIVPDLLVLAKALGGGLPLGAFVGSAAVMQTLAHDPPLAHVTTFGGHPVSCAAGLAALEVLLRDRLVARAAALGATLQTQLRALVGRGGLVVVRGVGLLVGLEFASAEAAAGFTRRALDGGLILNG